MLEFAQHYSTFLSSKEFADAIIVCRVGLITGWCRARLSVALSGIWLVILFVLHAAHSRDCDFTSHRCRNCDSLRRPVTFVFWTIVTAIWPLFLRWWTKWLGCDRNLLLLFLFDIKKPIKAKFVQIDQLAETRGQFDQIVVVQVERP